MAVGRDYLLEKPPGPSAAKRFLNQRMVPAAVNMAARGEVALDRASARSGIRPSILLAGLTGALLLSAFYAMRSKPASPRRGLFR